MIVLREIIATILLIAAILLTIYICTNIFSWGYLALAIGSYIAAYWIWPSKRQGQRDDNYIWFDIIEFLIELPFRIVFWLFRSFKDGDGPGIDL